MTATISRPIKVNPTSSEVSSDATNSRPATISSSPISGTPGGSDFPATKHAAMPGDAASRGTDAPNQAASRATSPVEQSLLDPALCLAADVLDDIERVRIANENRVRQMTRSVEDADGEERGFGLDPSHPDVTRLVQMVEALSTLEHQATLELQRRLRRHPLGAWVKTTRGVGEKQGARLLAAIGDPYINSAKGQPRTVSALWAYCGLHVLPGGHGAGDTHLSSATKEQYRDTDHSSYDDQIWYVGVAAKRKKGERANWSTKAKMRAYLIAESCIKQLDKDCRNGHVPSATRGTGAVPAQDPQDRADPAGADAQRNLVAQPCGCSPYRVAYDQRRAHTVVTHPEWTDGHSHNDALRVASKAILRDLWRAARDWHLAQPH